MARHTLEIENLRAFHRECGEEPAFTRSGEAAQDHETIARGKHFQPADHMPAIRSVAAVELHRTPADLVQDVGERAAALSAAPAIDQRFPVARLVGERTVEHRGDVSCHERRAQPARLECGTGVQGADAGALGVVEHRQIHCTGNVIVRELRRASHIDAVGEGVKRVDAHAQRDGVALAHRDLPGSPSNGLSCGHTLSSILACAAITGWMRSPWNIASSSAKPSNRKGTSATLRARATSAKVVSKRCTYAGP